MNRRMSTLMATRGDSATDGQGNRRDDVRDDGERERDPSNLDVAMTAAEGDVDLMRQAKLHAFARARVRGRAGCVAVR